MSSEGEASDTAQAPAQPPSRAALAVDVVKATYIPLLVGLLCLVGLVALWYYGVPWRPIAIVVILTCVMGPFAVCYSFLFSYVLNRRASIPVILVDDQGIEHGLIYFDRAGFSEVEVEGGKLGTRQTKAGTAYLAEDYRIEQRERVNEETGEVETYAQKVLETGWEGECEPMEVVERWKAYHEQRKRLVPLAKQSVQVRAASDDKLLENSMAAAHATILGAEKDEFFDDSVDPLDWDINVDKDDITEVVGAADSDGDRDETPEPGARSMQEDVEEVPADD